MIVRILVNYCIFMSHLFTLSILLLEYIRRAENVDFNFPDVGFLRSCGLRYLNYRKNEPLIKVRNEKASLIPGLPRGYDVKRIVVTVGSGRKDFYRASQYMLGLKLTNSLAWVQLLQSPDVVNGSGDACSEVPPRGRKSLKPGDTIATLSRFYGSCLWSLNPCRVIAVENARTFSFVKPSLKLLSTRGTDGPTLRRGGVYSEIVYSTLRGHLIAGEESLRVFLAHSGQVDFEVISYSKGCGIMGWLMMPLIRPLQRKFLLDHADAMTAFMRCR